MIIAGLTNHKIEFFAHNGEVKMLTNGRVYHFDEIDIEILNRVREELEEDERALHSLESDLKITDPVEQLKQYILCNYSKLDGVADLGADSEKEYCNCQMRGSCKAEGKLCSKLHVKNGVLSRSEINIIELVALDFSEKEIACKLNLSEFTVRTHRQNIEHKIDAKSHKGIVAFYFTKII